MADKSFFIGTWTVRTLYGGTDVEIGNVFKIGLGVGDLVTLDFDEPSRPPLAPGEDFGDGYWPQDVQDKGIFVASAGLITAEIPGSSVSRSLLIFEDPDKPGSIRCHVVRRLSDGRQTPGEFGADDEG